MGARMISLANFAQEIIEKKTPAMLVLPLNGADHAHYRNLL